MNKTLRPDVVAQSGGKGRQTSEFKASWSTKASSKPAKVTESPPDSKQIKNQTYSDFQINKKVYRRTREIGIHC